MYFQELLAPEQQRRQQSWFAAASSAPSSSSPSWRLLGVVAVTKWRVLLAVGLWLSIYRPPWAARAAGVVKEAALLPALRVVRESRAAAFAGERLLASVRCAAAAVLRTAAARRAVGAMRARVHRHLGELRVAADAKMQLATTSVLEHLKAALKVPGGGKGGGT